MDIQRPDPEVILEELNKQEYKKGQGKLKIFFGYSAGVGKTYSMLEEAHELKAAGVDVVIGYVEPHQRPATIALFEGLPSIPPLEIAYKGIVLSEFDIDSAIIRHPKVILVDELAHPNAQGCRHSKRYQDIEELLRMGIDVYTTVNVQHIEGLHDVVESITGIAVRERVPDLVFDNADKVELVDIEPEDLISRLKEGKIYRDVQAQKALSNFFTKENLIALREIALRRTADRVNITVEKNKNLQNNSTYFTDEHIMMCLSSSPSNAKVIRTAAKMVEAFHGTFTALFVETTYFAGASENSKRRLRDNLRLAEQLGAKVVTVYGDDIAYQVAEYAKASGVSKIVLGRPVTKRFLGFSTQNYVDRLTSFAPDLEIYVIPNKMTRRRRNISLRLLTHNVSFLDTAKALGCLAAATLVGYFFNYHGFSDTNIITVYILASLFTAVITEGKIYSLASALLSVILFNFFFTKPYYSFITHDPGYPVTFLVMFLAAFITSTFTKRVKTQARQASLKAYRTEVLLETSQELQQVKDKNGIFFEIIKQVKKLLDREVILYPAVGKDLGEAILMDKEDKEMSSFLTADEFAVAQWVYANNKHAGATTNTLSGAKCLYLSIRNGDTVFAVIGVAMGKERKMESFEKSLLIAMLAECGLALEKESILEAKNEVALKANSERLRSSLLRAISHDLRTPLTGIAGGSNFLLESFDSLDKETILSMLSNISSDALWLSNLVENLLNMTKIQNGLLTVSKKNEVVEDIISAAIAKVQKRGYCKKINLHRVDDMILVPMDARLMMQVIINLLDNASKHTKEGSIIEIEYSRELENFVLLISDNGGGIPADRIDKIFESFFTTSQISDDRQRGIGLGLNICKSIVEAHGGQIIAENNDIGGTTFKITLPLEK